MSALRFVRSHRWRGPRHRRPGLPEPVLGLFGALVSCLIVAVGAGWLWVWLLTSRL